MRKHHDDAYVVIEGTFHRIRNVSRVTYDWLEKFQADGKLALWPEVQAMARELMERRREDLGK